MKTQDTRTIVWLALIICMASVFSAQSEREVPAQGAATEIVSSGR